MSPHRYEIKLWIMDRRYLAKRIRDIRCYARTRGEKVVKLEHWKGYSGEFYTWITTQAA